MVEEQVIQTEQQPKKKKSHKGAIIAWSIIGTVVIVIGVIMLLTLNSMKNNSPTSWIAGKTFYADTDSQLVVIKDGKYDADSDAQKKVKDKIASGVASGDEGAKQISELMTTYSSSAIKNKFAGSYVKGSKTTLFNYSTVKATLYSSSDTEWYNRSYKVDGSGKGLDYYLVGDEKEQLLKLHAVDANISFGYSHSQVGVVTFNTFSVYYQIGTVTVDSKTYSIQFEVEYLEKI